MVGVSKTKYAVVYTCSSKERCESFVDFVKSWSDVAYIYVYTIDSTGEKSESRMVYRAF